jgi:DNA polymerase
MAANYHIDMADIYDALWAAAEPQEREQAVERYADVFEKGNNDWLPRRAWIACQLTVRAWRRANKPIVEMWDQFHSAAWHTLEESGTEHRAGRVAFKREGGFLWLTLPSGRRLAYPTPAKENLEVPWSDKRLPSKEREHKDMLTVLAFEKGKAMRYPFYPGLTFQHAVQAIARDLLANGMNKVEAAGYPVVMSIHDEVICEVSDADGQLDDFVHRLCDTPPWAAGLPLLADGWSGFRYRKTA